MANLTNLRASSSTINDYRLPINLTGWTKVRVRRAKFRYFSDRLLREEEFHVDFEEQISWLKQNIPWHQIKTEMVIDPNLKHETYLDFFLYVPKPKDLMRYKLRWG